MSEAIDSINVLWVLGCTAAVFLMQAGFCCLEAGLVRAKNSINVAIKNVVDLCVSGLMFWLVGYALMFGTSFHGLFGGSGFCMSTRGMTESAFFLFQLAFCGTVITIVSGAVAERMQFSGYVIVSLALAGFIYPIIGHWAWGGLSTGTAAGWLEQLGYVDFAGSGVVHAVGGWVALAAALVLGPRQGRFEDTSQSFQGHNLPMSALGVLLLWVGWFGFNGGSTLEFNESVPRILINTAMGAAGGGALALAVSWLQTGRADVCDMQNGILAGLVSITASCHVISVPAAVCIGAVGSIIAMAGCRLLIRWRIDDVVSAVPVHAFAGVWGVLAVALFGDPSAWGTGHGRLAQFLVQLTGAATIFGWAFAVGYSLLRVINYFHPLRVPAESERLGLNVSEHDASYELLDLLTEMESHRQSGDFTLPTTVVSQTEVGQIAEQYDRVLDAVNTDRVKLLEANRQIQRSTIDAETMRDRLQEKVAELEEFNRCAVGRELRMVELKQEINSLLVRFGESPQYEIDIAPEMVPCEVDCCGDAYE